MLGNVAVFSPSQTEGSKERIVNDFSMTFCTVNGSGSATANTTLLRAFFEMGIPVSGKNIFPSNIQGLPTWYSIRVNRHGYLARSADTQLMIAMNTNSFTKDLERLVPGGVLFYPEDFKLTIERQDLILYPMPIKKLSKEADIPAHLKEFISNMVYVGVMAHILGMPLEYIHKALEFHFQGKAKPIASNFQVVVSAAEWASQNLVKQDPYWVEKMDKNQGAILTDGNLAGALGAIYGGLQFLAWYPITPATNLAETVVEYLPSLRKDSATGKDTCVVLQAEDEIAAVGMATGAGWAGLRAMTSTSGPGFSLMTEYAGLAYLTEVPLVIWDVQRVGPGTGLPTRTSQGDLTMAYFLGHGDTHYVILIPGSVTECFEFGWKAFDLAERLQTPVLILSDLDLGMNQWTTPQFVYPDQPIDRGKILWEADLEKAGRNWKRFRDMDGDGIPYRTVMGNRHPMAPYFTRGTGHDEEANYSEDPQDWERNIERIKKKFDLAKGLVPCPEIEQVGENKIGLISMGSADMAIRETQALLAGQDIPTDYMRIRALPFNQQVADFINRHARNYVIELNQDGQLCQLLTLYLGNSEKLVSTAHIDGLPITAKWILEKIVEHEERM